jgi:hypothetical protein
MLLLEGPALPAPLTFRRTMKKGVRGGNMVSPATDGEGRNRTGDTTVFSRVLYQLSYLARGEAV